MKQMIRNWKILEKLGNLIHGDTANGEVNIDGKLIVGSDLEVDGKLKAGGETGTAGQVLKSTGTGIEWGTAGGGAGIETFNTYSTIEILNDEERVNINSNGIYEIDYKYETSEDVGTIDIHIGSNVSNAIIKIVNMSVSQVILMPYVVFEGSRKGVFITNKSPYSFLEESFDFPNATEISSGNNNWLVILGSVVFTENSFDFY